MEMSVFELKVWAAYFKIEADREKEAYNKARKRK
jgi:hypothetical protein